MTALEEPYLQLIRDILEKGHQLKQGRPVYLVIKCALI